MAQISATRRQSQHHRLIARRRRNLARNNNFARRISSPTSASSRQYQVTRMSLNPALHHLFASSRRTDRKTRWSPNNLYYIQRGLGAHARDPPAGPFVRAQDARRGRHPRTKCVLAGKSASIGCARWWSGFLGTRRSVRVLGGKGGRCCLLWCRSCGAQAESAGGAETGTGEARGGIVNICGPYV